MTLIVANSESYMFILATKTSQEKEKLDFTIKTTTYITDSLKDTDFHTGNLFWVNENIAPR